MPEFALRAQLANDAINSTVYDQAADRYPLEQEPSGDGTEDGAGNISRQCDDLSISLITQSDSLGLAPLK